MKFFEESFQAEVLCQFVFCVDILTE